ncbi:MAG: hypothetical protein HC937_03085 [Aquincola sp.]|nr:hypothetical protein [Aquincola sp.]
MLQPAHKPATLGEVCGGSQCGFGTALASVNDLDGAPVATEIISEIYVPRSSLVRFMADVRKDFRENSVGMIYGTIRLIEKDEEIRRAAGLDEKLGVNSNPKAFLLISDGQSWSGEVAKSLALAWDVPFVGSITSRPTCTRHSSKTRTSSSHWWCCWSPVGTRC